MQTPYVPSKEKKFQKYRGYVFMYSTCRERIVKEDFHNIEFDMITRNSSNIAPYLTPLHHDGEGNPPTAEYFFPFLIYLGGHPCLHRRKQIKISKSPCVVSMYKVDQCTIQLRRRRNPPPLPILSRIFFKQKMKESLKSLIAGCSFQ